MRKVNTFVLLLASILLLLPSLRGQEQERYLDRIFDKVDVTRDVTYGVNATVLLSSVAGEAVPQELKMDIYTPSGDTEAERPAVLLLHTGNFLPIVLNGGLQGNRQDSSVVEMANRLAQMGYVAAIMDYRQGWNPTAETQDQRTLGLLQAAYRGVQDIRTAIRFFKRDAVENQNTFAVDTSRMVVWGVGTGGYASLAAATLDDFLKVTTASNPQGKFLTESPINPGILVPMVIPEFNGDIFGLGFGVLPVEVPPLPAGDTLNYPNHEGFNSDFQLCVNLGGALGDISWLEAGQMPTITFQVPTDPFAPYVDDVLIVPTTNDPVVQVQGGRLVAEKANEVGNQEPFKSVALGEGQFGEIAWVDPLTIQAEVSSVIAGHNYFEGLYPFVRPTNEFGNEEGDPWTWWDPSAPAPGQGMGIPWNQLPHPSGDRTYHEDALQNNADMSPEKAKTYIDTVMGYYAPRAFLALDLGSYETLVDRGVIAISTSSTPVLSDGQVDMQLMPNPAFDQVRITTGLDYPMQAVQVFDFSGRLAQSHTRLNDNTFYIDRGNLPPGMYVAKVHFKEGVVAKKIVFKD